MENPFNGYTVYGPIYHKRIGRRMVFLRKDKRMTSMTYARYKMCMSLGRWLNLEEQVDHIDNNKMNDAIDNLQILSAAENTRKSKKGITYLTLVCPNCKESFTRPRNNTHIVKGGRPSKCSRKCVYDIYRKGV